MVRRLGEIGLIRDDDIREGQTIAGVVKEVVDRELTAAVGPLGLLTLSAEIGSGEIEQYAEVDEKHADLDESSRIHFAMGVMDIPTICVGKTLLALEQIKPGLGETVYAVLIWAGSGSMGLFTFHHVFENIPWLYELEDEGEEEESDSDSEDGRPSKDELLENVPKWAASPKLRISPLEVDALIRKRGTPTWAIAVLKAALDAADCWKMGHGRIGYIDSYDAQPVYCMANVRFNSEDSLSRILDDYFDMCNGCADNYTENSHLEIVYHENLEEFKAWWEGILAGCRLIASIDKLLGLLSEANAVAE